MNKYYVTKTIFLILSTTIFIVITPAVLGQNKLKEIWSPPDESFTLFLPVKLRNTDLYSGVNRNSPDYKLIKTYEGSIPNYDFLVLLLDYGNNISKKRLEEKFEGLNFVIGGDDDNNFEERYLKVDNLNAKELNYLNQNKKGLMIDTGKQIIVLSLTAGKRKYLNSVIANEFLTSFQLLKS